MNGNGNADNACTDKENRAERRKQPECYENNLLPDPNVAFPVPDINTVTYDDRLIIGKFCQIASGVEFIMNGANHQ